MRLLVVQLERELNDARPRSTGGNGAECGRHQHVVVGIAEVGKVEDVEQLRAELQVALSCKWEMFADAEVYVALAGATALGPDWLSDGAWSAQAAQLPGHNLPTFEVDRTWPKVPARWKLNER